MPVPSDWPQQIAAAGGAYWPLSLFNDEPFAEVFTFPGLDMTGAAFSGGVRAAFEESSAVLQAFTFTPVLIGSDTMVTVSISEADVEALRSGFDPGAIETLFHNIKCTRAGSTKLTYFAGEFKLQGA
jgi:hypothetical protein